MVVRPESATPTRWDARAMTWAEMGEVRKTKAMTSEPRMTAWVVAKWSMAAMAMRGRPSVPALVEA